MSVMALQMQKYNLILHRQLRATLQYKRGMYWTMLVEAAEEAEGIQSVLRTCKQH